MKTIVLKVRNLPKNVDTDLFVYCMQQDITASYPRGKVELVPNLLKEQEAVEPIPFHRSDETIFRYECRKCRTKIFKNDLFCRHCGRKVKWDD